MRHISAFAALAFAGSAFGQIGLVDFDGTELGLTGYSNPSYTYSGSGFGTNASLVTPGTATSTWVAGDSFWPMSRGNVGPNNIGMPFGISDDSVAPAAGNSLFANDTLGFAGTTLGNNGFFGVMDILNPANSAPISASFTFNIAGFSNLSVSIDFIAMGDYEATNDDAYNFEYSIDGGLFQPLFTSSIDENLSQNYTMDIGTVVNLGDPLFINSVMINDVYQTLTASVLGTGNSLTIRFTASGDADGMGFDNLRVDGVPTPGAAVLMGVAGVVGFRRRR